MKNSILYMLFEGLSKGGNQLILLYIAYAFEPEFYLILMLLISLETLLPVFMMSNYSEILYTLKAKFNKEKVFSTILSLTLITTVFFIALMFLFNVPLYTYFNYSNVYVYLAIPINIFYTVYFKFLSMYYQLEEKHTVAIYLKSLPFFLSFLGALLGIFFFEDKILGFFMGKLSGFTLSFLFFIFKDKVFEFELSLDKEFILEFLSRSKFLFLITIFGWLGTYGFLNMGKIFSTPENVVQYAYLINVYMLFLMIANGINQVYSPRLRKIYHNNITEAYRYSNKALVLYFTIAIIAFSVNEFILYVNNIFHFIDERAMRIFSILPYAIFIFWVSSFKYTSDVYVYVTDSYKQFTLSILIVEVVSFLLVIYLLQIYSISLLYGYFIIIFSRSFYTFLYTRLILNQEQEKKHDE